MIIIVQEFGGQVGISQRENIFSSFLLTVPEG